MAVSTVDDSDTVGVRLGVGLAVLRRLSGARTLAHRRGFALAGGC
jgi:hypothetical protein